LLDRASRERAFDAVVFDLLTALIDSWSLWNSVAGSPPRGLAWRRRYLELTYRAGAYRPYEGVVREAASQSGIDTACADELVRRWGELSPWPETHEVVAELAQRVPHGIATNCSVALGRIAAERSGGPYAAIATAESVGYYKPRPEPYRAVLATLKTDPARTLFVAGSAADVPGAKAVGMPVYWHNRMALAPVDECRPDFTAASLYPLMELVR
jgi:2-haloalkanoic acid dehalogenase type II